MRCAPAAGLVLLALLLTILAPPAAACSCVPPRTPTGEFVDAGAVFAGRAVDVSADALGDVTAVFAVDRWWKGGSNATVSVLTGRDTAGCGFPFVAGEDYLVYADGRPLSAGLCSRTAKLADAGADVRELGPGAPPASPAAGTAVSTVVAALAAVIVIGIAFAALVKTGRITVPKSRHWPGAGKR